MAGEIARMITTIIEKKSSGNPKLESTIKVRLALRGVDVTKYCIESPDDEAIMIKLREFAKESGIIL